LLLRALHSIYVALGAFASATLVTLLGAGAAPLLGELWLHAMAWLGVTLGTVGVGGLVLGCANLFHATRLSLINIREDASLVRERLAPSKKAGRPMTDTNKTARYVANWQDERNSAALYRAIAEVELKAFSRGSGFTTGLYDFVARCKEASLTSISEMPEDSTLRKALEAISKLLDGNFGCLQPVALE